MAKQDIYQAVTDRIIEALDRGTVPWRNPIAGAGLSFPHNLTTGKAYRGINVLLLACTALDQGYRSGYWMTFKQAKDHGGQVRKGEKSTPIVFFKKLEVEDQKTGEEKKIPMLRKYNVFNVEQVEGIEPQDLEGFDPDRPAVAPLDIAQTILKGYVLPPAIQTEGLRAFYHPPKDAVYMPPPEEFESAEAHASILFHELIHSTGHSKRLDRGINTKLAPFGSPDYSKEELIAECGAAFLCATAGILPQTIDQSAAYIESWRKALKGDKRLIVQSAAAAQRAVDHILGVSWEEATTPQPTDDPRKPGTTANSDVPGAEAKSGVSDQDLDQVMEMAAPVRRGPQPSITHEVDPGRLEYGRWSQEFNETVGEGDIAAAYCADTIALHNKVRTPFVFRGDLWVVVSLAGNVAKAYQLVPLDDFYPEPMSFAEKTRDCEAARNDPNGFYHEVPVMYRKDWFVLSGPPALFVPGQVQQPGLFGDLAL